MSYLPSERRLVGRPANRDFDAVVTQRLLDGDRSVRANWHEIDAAILTLQANGLTGRDIARRIGLSDSAVYRHNGQRHKKATA